MRETLLCIVNTMVNPSLVESELLGKDRHSFINMSYLLSTSYMAGIVLRMRDTVENEQV